MVGLLEPTSGSIKIDGYDIRTQPLEVKKSIAYVPDNPDIYEKLTGIEYLNFIADVYDVPSHLRQETNAIGGLIEGYSHGMRYSLVHFCIILRFGSAFGFST